MRPDAPLCGVAVTWWLAQSRGAMPDSRKKRSGSRLALRLAASLLFAAAPAALAAEPELTAVGAAVASGSDLLDTSIVAEKLESPVLPGQGAGRFVPATRLAAGDEVHYTLRVTNPGKAPVTDVQVTKRMPQGLQFIPGSAVGPASVVEFSADGGTSFTAKPKGGELTHVRWSLRRPLPPGATALLRFRATFR
jgi:uncharacterized repeat protein (TIGR01451 family)